MLPSGFRTCDNLFLLFQEYIYQKNAFMFVAFKLRLNAFYFFLSLYTCLRFLFCTFILCQLEFYLIWGRA